MAEHKRHEKPVIMYLSHSPYNSPVWPVRKPDGRWHLMMDYRRLSSLLEARLAAPTRSIESGVGICHPCSILWHVSKGTTGTGEAFVVLLHLIQGDQTTVLRLGKGVLSLTRVVKEAEKFCTPQDVIVQDPFALFNSILYGSPPPKGVAHKATVWKWYAYLEGISQLLPFKEGLTKASRLQQPTNPDPALLG
ncbi:hypothetical protein QYF61_017732 [Mycteria americana]|uniref:Uncharacterized protein n=1 Tax=Mycteria americana TaxID=33587 RepID=A0AAN7NRB8_MYCAM|nr:hypothetical protein QYF61_017732 [Mycteria americana]